MATAKRAKATLEFLLVKAEVKGIPEKRLLRSRRSDIKERQAVVKVRYSPS